MSVPRVVLVSFVGPRRRIDAAADAETPLRSLLEPVQGLLGVDLDATGSRAPVVRLLPAGDTAGIRAADLGRSLRTLGAVDGDVVSLFPWEPGDGGSTGAGRRTGVATGGPVGPGTPPGGPFP